MQAEEIRELSADEIESRIRDLEEERFRLRFRNATEPLEDPLRLRVIRKDIARLRTVLRENLTRQQTQPKTSAGGQRAGRASAR
jgi:large subunit ribosomal protein L29